MTGFDFCRAQLWAVNPLTMCITIAITFMENLENCQHAANPTIPMPFVWLCLRINSALIVAHRNAAMDSA